MPGHGEMQGRPGLGERLAPLSLWNPALQTFPTSELFLVLMIRLLTWAELTQSCRACKDNWDVTGETAKRLGAWLETALKVSQNTI